jgi:hypothetical protein
MLPSKVDPFLNILEAIGIEDYGWYQALLARCIQLEIDVTRCIAVFPIGTTL